jgi:hypothetical protein
VRRLRGIACSLLLLPLSGCGAVSGALEDVTKGCGTPDDALVDDVMATARQDFVPGGDPGKRPVSRVELVRAKVVDLPDDLQGFDLDQLMVITTAQFFADVKPGSAFPGMHLPTVFALESDTDRAVPVDEFAVDTFELGDPVMDDPGWEEWVESVTFSKPWEKVQDCADDEAG